MGPQAVNAFADYNTGEITVYERGASGGLTKRAVRGEFVCYLAKKDCTRELLRSLRTSRNVAGISQEGEAWVRVVWRSRGAREAACEPVNGWFSKQNIPTYEADVPALRRWMIDQHVTIQRPRRVYLDIETCGRVPFSKKEESRVLCWTLSVEQDIERARVVAQGVLSRDDDRAERGLLVELWVALGDYDQVLAWNGDEFDFPVIWARSKRGNIALDPRRWLWLDHLELFRRMNANSAESGDEKQKMSLEAVARAVLREGKTEGVSYDKLFPWWEAGGELRQKVLDYNARDVELMCRIEVKTGYVELQQTLGDVTGIFSDTSGIQPMQQVESFMLRLGKEQGVHFQTRKRDFEEGDVAVAFRGAFVMDPVGSGMQRDVHVADFASMYPSIILSFNMSPDTLKPEDAEEDFLTSLALAGPSYLRKPEPVSFGPDPIPEGYARAPITGVLFEQERRGILALALEHMGKMRKHWSELQASLPPGTSEWVEAGRRSMAYKVASNSFFGVVGARVSRLYEPSVAESISQGGVWLIRETIKAAQGEPWKFRVIYGDTDSLFVTGCTDERFREFCAWCNAELYPRLLREQGASRNTVKIAYEKKFERVVMVSAKRYAGRYAHYKGKPATKESKPEIKGLEYKRGDAVKLARRLQALVVDGLLGGGVEVPEGLGEPSSRRDREERCEEGAELFASLVLAFRERLLTGALELHDVVMSKRLTKPLKEYVVKTKKDGTDGAPPPHVRVAKVLAARGENVSPGTRIEYVITDGRAKPAAIIPASDWVGECDRADLWESHVWPPTERLLMAAFPGTPWGGYGRVHYRGGTAQQSLSLGSLAQVLPLVRSAPHRTLPDRSEGQGSLFSLSDAAGASSSRDRAPKRAGRSE